MGKRENGEREVRKEEKKEGEQATAQLLEDHAGREANTEQDLQVGVCGCQTVSLLLQGVG